MRFSRLVTLLAVTLVTLSPVVAEETGWSTIAELGLVVTGGNSESQTLALNAMTIKEMEKSRVTLKAGALNAENTSTFREGIGTLATFTVNEVDTTTTSAESYFFEGRYDRDITERFFWFAGAGWNKNEPSGIDKRYTAFAGVGNIWRDDEDVKFRTDYGLAWTDQTDVIPTPTSVNDYVSARASWAYSNQLTETTAYINDFVVDFAVDDLDNFHADMLNAVQVAVSSRVALKVSLRTLYNNLPPSEFIQIFDTPGGTLLGAAPFELDELDTIFNASVVVNF